MTTPIYDFVKNYIQLSPARLHMPGHKGTPLLGWEPYDITEIDGADNLYDPQGVIRESEENAASLFGTQSTLYSTEGSSQCIRAMLYLAVLAFGEKHPGVRPTVVAGRNSHKAFLTAAALLDVDIVWLFPENADRPGLYSLCRCDISPAQLEHALAETPNAAAVYLTSPDYLGNTTDIPALAETAHRRNVPLLVDNAHGAYLRFLDPSRHPADLGADLCCDSAHKTLPVLTGGAYLHIGHHSPKMFPVRARAAMAMFGSTSPSYLILQSLDRANQYLVEGYPEKLAGTVRLLRGLKARLGQEGWLFAGDEPLKLTIDARASGYTGPELAAHLQGQNIHCEYADPDYLVLMPTPETPAEVLHHLEASLAALRPRPPLSHKPPPFQKPERRMSVREALFAPCETVAVGDTLGRTVASLAVSCPPAVSPAVPGEVVAVNTVDIYRYYGIERIAVVKE